MACRLLAQSVTSVWSPPGPEREGCLLDIPPPKHAHQPQFVVASAPHRPTDTDVAPRYDARFVDSSVLRIAARSENQLQAGVQLVANRQAVVLEGAKVFPAAEGRYGEAHTMRCAALPECVLQVVSGISRECIG